MKIWYAALNAMRENEHGKTASGVAVARVIARTFNDAKRKALAMAEREFPAADGWKSHQSAVMQMDEGAIVLGPVSDLFRGTQN